MGSWTSHNSTESESPDQESSPNSSKYRYPPKAGNFFESHFIMGGERFDTPQPEQYLFGDNSDLNFFGGKPIPFPYPAPATAEPLKPLKCLVNIRKESLRFTKAPVAGTPEDGAKLSEPNCSNYNIEFVVDCDAKCLITIMYFCSEEITATGVIYRPRDTKMNSEPMRFKPGANQIYSNISHVFNPSMYDTMDLQFDFENEVYPIVILCQVLEGEEPRQSHVTTASVEKYSDGTTYYLKPIKQKIFMDGLLYIMQEIYGIENKKMRTSGSDEPKNEGDESDESASEECVICMSDSRDTLILPCRHLCLCHSCADSLRYQANNCPICRAPFRALLQIRAVYKTNAPSSQIEFPHPLNAEISSLSNPGHIVPGYKTIPLLEALNGPSLSAADSDESSTVRADAPKSSVLVHEANELHPVTMTVMVSPSEPTLNELPEDEGSTNSSCTKIPMVLTNSELKSLSDPDYEEQFGEGSKECLPDLSQFPSSNEICSVSITNESSMSNVPVATEPTAKSSHRDQINASELHMIASIDEFSDDEDYSHAKEITREKPISCQTTPIKFLDRKDFPQGYRYVKTSAASVPSTPSSNCRSPGCVSAAGTAYSASTRSSGDSFTSASSSKQLLPSSANAAKAKSTV